MAACASLGIVGNTIGGVVGVDALFGKDELVFDYERRGPT